MLMFAVLVVNIGAVWSLIANESEEKVATIKMDEMIIAINMLKWGKECDEIESNC